MSPQTPSPSPASSPEDVEQLVAYLDGELDPAQAATVSARLAKNRAAQRQALELQEAWKLLDSLPQPEVTPEFTSRTLNTTLGSGLPVATITPRPSRAEQSRIQPQPPKKANEPAAPSGPTVARNASPMAPIGPATPAGSGKTEVMPATPEDESLYDEDEYDDDEFDDSTDGSGESTALRRSFPLSRRSAALATAAAVMFLVGYFCVQRFFPNPTVELSKNLSIAEHAENYKAIQTWERIQILERYLEEREPKPKDKASSDGTSDAP